MIRWCTFLAVAGLAAASALVTSWSGILRGAGALAALPEAFEGGAGAATDGFLISGLAADVFPLQQVADEVK